MDNSSRTFITFLLALTLLHCGTFVSAQKIIPAFPGAEGYGKESLGGRGGKIIEVTNLNDKGEGSLRAAIETSGARIIVFRVAGIIEIASGITITNPFITIAGQTAPGDGICIKFSPEGMATTALNIQTHDVIIRYLRIRCGFSKAKMDYGSPISNGSGYNIIIDHCSTSWHPGRSGMTIWGKSVKNITIQHHLASEALLGGNYPDGARGAFLFGSGVDRITMYNNLMAHNRKRHPEAKTIQRDSGQYIATFQIINNVAYHFDNDGMLLIGNENNSKSYNIPDNEVCHYNVIGNYFKRSVIKGQKHSEISITPGVRVYAGDNKYGNIGPGRPDSTLDPWALVSFINWNIPKRDSMLLHAPVYPFQSLTPFNPDDLPPYVTADNAYKNVLNDVGANKALNADGSFRNVSDPVDIRVIKDVINNTGDFIKDPADAGGWPDYSIGAGPYTDTDKDGMSDNWEKKYRLNPNDPADSNKDTDNDGYTNVEEFLNGSNPKLADSIPTDKNFKSKPD